MQIDTLALRKIIREELHKRTAEKTRIQRRLEELDRQQRTLRLNLEFVSSVEGLAFLFDTILGTEAEDIQVYQVAAERPAGESETHNLSPTVREERDPPVSDLIRRLMEDELQNFEILRRKY